MSRSCIPVPYQHTSLPRGQSLSYPWQSHFHSDPSIPGPPTPMFCRFSSPSHMPFRVRFYLAVPASVTMRMIEFCPGRNVFKPPFFPAVRQFFIAGAYNFQKWNAVFHRIDRFAVFWTHQFALFVIGIPHARSVVKHLQCPGS